MLEAVELLGFHLQMKTTWPAAWAVWKQMGEVGRAASDRGGPLPLPSPRRIGLQMIAFNPLSPPVSRWFQGTGLSHPGCGQLGRCDPELRKVTPLSDLTREEEQQVAQWPPGQVPDFTVKGVSKADATHAARGRGQ